MGNVLSHYSTVSHDVLDKFEKGRSVINEDVIDFRPSKQYDLILSVSTFEHIGFDDETAESSGQKIMEAIAACRRLLTREGVLVLTLPIGYNPDLDNLIRGGRLSASREFYMRRIERATWVPCEKTEALKCRYKAPFPYANGLLVAEFSKPDKEISGAA